MGFYAKIFRAMDNFVFSEWFLIVLLCPEKGSIVKFGQNRIIGCSN